MLRKYIKALRIEIKRNKIIFLIKNIVIPTTFLITLIFCLPFEQGITRAFWMFEWISYNPYAYSTIASSLIVLYTGLVLLCTYILLDKTPIIVAPVLALLTGQFASDYWELPKFVLFYLASYKEQFMVGTRPALSFLWSPSFLHLYCGLILFALLDFKLNRKKILIFFFTPWIMYIINGYHSLNINQISLGPLGTIVRGVASWLPNRIVCNLALIYIISDIKWRGMNPIMNFIKRFFG